MNQNTDSWSFSWPSFEPSPDMISADKQKSLENDNFKTEKITWKELKTPQETKDFLSVNYQKLINYSLKKANNNWQQASIILQNQINPYLPPEIKNQITLSSKEGFSLINFQLAVKGKGKHAGTLMQKKIDLFFEIAQERYKKRQEEIAKNNQVATVIQNNLEIKSNEKIFNLFSGPKNFIEEESLATWQNMLNNLLQNYQDLGIPPDRLFFDTDVSSQDYQSYFQELYTNGIFYSSDVNATFEGEIPVVFKNLEEIAVNINLNDNLKLNESEAALKDIIGKIKNIAVFPGNTLSFGPKKKINQKVSIVQSLLLFVAYKNLSIIQVEIAKKSINRSLEAFKTHQNKEKLANNLGFATLVIENSLKNFMNAVNAVPFSSHILSYKNLVQETEKQKKSDPIIQIQSALEKSKNIIEIATNLTGKKEHYEYQNFYAQNNIGPIFSDIENLLKNVVNTFKGLESKEKKEELTIMDEVQEELQEELDDEAMFVDFETVMTEVYQEILGGNTADSALNKSNNNSSDNLIPALQQDLKTGNFQAAQKKMQQKQDKLLQAKKNSVKKYEQKVQQAEKKYQASIKKIETNYQQELEKSEQNYTKKKLEIEQKYQNQLTQIKKTHEAQTNQIKKEYQENIDKLNTKISELEEKQRQNSKKLETKQQERERDFLQKNKNFQSAKNLSENQTDPNQFPQKKDKVEMGLYGEFKYESSLGGAPERMIVPDLGEIYFPTSVVNTFDQDGTGFTTNRRYEPYTNKTLAIKSTYTDKIKYFENEPIRLQIPYGYTVNTSTLKVDKKFSAHILKDNFGFIYLVFKKNTSFLERLRSNKGFVEKITFSIGLGKESEQDLKTELSTSERKICTKKLANAQEFSARTKNKLLQEVKNNPNIYQNNDDIANKVHDFIDETSVYADNGEKYDREMRALHSNKIIAADIYTKEFDEYPGEQLNPAQCSVAAVRAVAYLRELGVPAIVVGGQAKTGHSYGPHAWVRYYSNVQKKWIRLDPTPTRIVDPLEKKSDDKDLQNEIRLTEEIKQKKAEKESARQEKEEELARLSEEYQKKLEKFKTTEKTEKEKLEEDLEEKKAQLAAKKDQKLQKQQDQYDQQKKDLELEKEKNEQKYTKSILETYQKQVNLLSPLKINHNLAARLFPSSQNWSNKLNKIYQDYLKIADFPHKDPQKQKTIKEIKEFIQKTEDYLQKLITKPPAAFKKHPKMFTAYLEQNLARLEDLINLFPTNEDFFTLLVQLRNQFKIEQIEKIDYFIGDIDKNRSLVIISDTLCIKDKRSLTVERLDLDISKYRYDNLSVKTSNNDKHWVLQLNEQLVYKNNKEFIKYDNDHYIKTLVVNENGDVFCQVYDYSVNSNQSDQGQINNYDIYKNNTLISKLSKSCIDFLQKTTNNGHSAIFVPTMNNDKEFGDFYIDGKKSFTITDFDDYGLEWERNMFLTKNGKVIRGKNMWLTSNKTVIINIHQDGEPRKVFIQEKEYQGLLDNHKDNFYLYQELKNKFNCSLIDPEGNLKTIFTVNTSFENFFDNYDYHIFGKNNYLYLKKNSNILNINGKEYQLSSKIKHLFINNRDYLKNTNSTQNIYLSARNSQNNDIYLNIINGVLQEIPMKMNLRDYNDSYGNYFQTSLDNNDDSHILINNKKLVLNNKFDKHESIHLAQQYMYMKNNKIFYIFDEVLTILEVEETKTEFIVKSKSNMFRESEKLLPPNYDYNIDYNTDTNCWYVDDEAIGQAVGFIVYPTKNGPTFTSTIQNGEILIHELKNLPPGKILEYTVCFDGEKGKQVSFLYKTDDNRILLIQDDQIIYSMPKCSLDSNYRLSNNFKNWAIIREKQNSQDPYSPYNRELVFFQGVGVDAYSSTNDIITSTDYQYNRDSLNLPLKYIQATQIKSTETFLEAALPLLAKSPKNLKEYEKIMLLNHYFYYPGQFDFSGRDYQASLTEKITEYQNQLKTAQQKGQQDLITHLKISIQSLEDLQKNTDALYQGNISEKLENLAMQEYPLFFDKFLGKKFNIKAKTNGLMFVLEELDKKIDSKKIAKNKQLATIIKKIKKLDLRVQKSLLKAMYVKTGKQVVFEKGQPIVKSTMIPHTTTIKTVEDNQKYELQEIKVGPQDNTFWNYCLKKLDISQKNNAR